MLFKFFEKSVPCYPSNEPALPPRGFLAFVWACSRGVRGYVVAMAGLSALIAVYEAMLFFSWDVLLAVAVELAFSVAAVRVATRVEREGWLTAAVRLTWKPLLGALLCAVLLGATIDHFLPQVDSLPEAVRMLQGG